MKLRRRTELVKTRKKIEWFEALLDLANRNTSADMHGAHGSYGAGRFIVIVSVSRVFGKSVLQQRNLGL